MKNKTHESRCAILNGNTNHMLKVDWEGVVSQYTRYTLGVFESTMSELWFLV